ncbi:MAG TPA: PGF-pre-PGF domain-containing protein [Methanocorpusculum sp.]|nr:PGF-pre-PGF domain-containing protein [Methanocorpusculum sp.]
MNRTEDVKTAAEKREQKGMYNKTALRTAEILLIAVLAAVFLILPAAAASREVTVTSTAYSVSVTSDQIIGTGYTIDGQSGVSEAVVGKDGTAVIAVTAPVPLGYLLEVTHTGTAVFTRNGSTVTVSEIESDVTVSVKYVRKSTPSGGGGGYVAPPVQPKGPVVSDVTKQYSGMEFAAVSLADIASVRTVDAETAAELEKKLVAAEKAGIRLVNSRGAPAVVQTDSVLSELDTVAFSLVYDIKPANPKEKLTEVTVTVPKAYVTASGLTTDDVTIYHYLAGYGLWIPLDTLKIMQDALNYYYTAETDGASPFGVLIKQFAAEQTLSDIPVEPVTTPGFGVLAVMAGLGAVGVFFRARRK